MDKNIDRQIDTEKERGRMAKRQAEKECCKAQTF